MRNSSISRGLWPLALLVLVPALAGVGCVRMAVLPTADREITLPLSEPNTGAETPATLTKDPNQPYRVGPRDIVRVEVRKDPTLSQDYTITEEGNILVPNIGPLKVADLTTEEIAKKLLESLSEFIRFSEEPAEREKEVRVGVKEYNSKVIYVVGAVANPGPKVMRADQMTVKEAIYAAGLPTPEAALQRTRIITPDLKEMEL